MDVGDADEIRANLERYRTLKGGLLAESRTDPHAQRHKCPNCEDGWCITEQCLECWNAEFKRFVKSEFRNYE